ncbi:MAG: hydantoin racemase, partial [Zestosphaera sp.]
PTVLFAAKLQLYIELLSTALANPLNTLVLATALAGSGLSLASFIKVIVTTILSPKPREGVRLSRVLEAYVIALAGLTIALGVFYTIIQEQLTAPASNILLNGRGLYINEVLQALFRG